MTAIVQRSNHAPSLAFVRKAHAFVREAGWPEHLAFSVMTVISWQLSPSDYAMRAKIRVTKKDATATLTISYMGREINMILIRFDGQKTVSEGLLYKDNLDLAFQCFRSHAQIMMHGPIQLKEAA